MSDIAVLVDEANNLLFSLADKTDYAAVSLTAASVRRLCTTITDLQARLEAAEAQNAKLREAGQAALRAADLALFVIRKQGVMPNSSWEAGFNRDTEHARATLGGEHG